MAPCNCGRNRRPPLSPYSNPTPSSTSTGNTTQDPAKPWRLRTSTGTQYFGSKLEAEAALLRAGGGSIVKVM